MSRVVYKSAQAKHELVDHYEYIARDSADAAERFLSAVESAVTQLAARPGMGARWESPHPQLSGVRTWLVPRFRNYVIFYREREDGIEVLHVFHGAQDLETLLARDAES